MYDPIRDICGWLREPEVNSDEPVIEFDDIVPYGTRITERLLRRMRERASPSRYPVRAKKKPRRVLAKKEPQREPARGCTPAEMVDMVYNNPGRPQEGANANWVRYTLNSMAQFKQLNVGPSDWFQSDEVQRWFTDFGPDETLSAFRSFVANKPKSNSDHPLHGFRASICTLCTGATRLESYAYSVGELTDARRKQLGIGRNYEQSPDAAVGNENVAPEAVTPEKAFDIAIEISEHLMKLHLQNWQQGQGGLKLWLSCCQDHSAHEVLEVCEDYLRSHQRMAVQYGTPMVGLCVIGPVIFNHLQECKANATKQAVDPSTGKKQERMTV